MRKTEYQIILISLISLSLFSCTTYKPFYAKSELDWKKANNPDSLKLNYTVFLVGDVGKPSLDKQEPTLKLLEKQLYHIEPPKNKILLDSTLKNTSSEKDAIIFLGDNIYDYGMPLPDAADREQKENYLKEQMNIVKNFKGKKIFIPGNHDWNKSRIGGLAALKRQEEFVENYSDSTNLFLPSNGCAGPVEIKMNGNLVIIAIDSEWWLTNNARSDRYEQGCSAITEDQVIAQVNDILLRNKGKNIVFTEHHPLFTNGKHGGYFTLKDYFFPLTLVKDNLYIPLPIIGSIYPLLRQYGLSPQDVSNKKYQSLKSKLLNVFDKYDNVVVATGHEHALQLTKYKKLNHIISGAGSKNSALFKGNGALFGHGTKGFAKLNYYNNGQCWVEFWEPNKEGETGTLIYRAPLYALPATKKTILAEDKSNYKDSTKYVAVGARYKASNTKRLLFGEHYRSVWATPITIQYLDLTVFAGGLTPLQLGGGKQTTSLRMLGKDKIQYQFRTIDKDPSALLPDAFKSTFADDFVQDQISSAHPFGALAIPDMADAIGVFHTSPKVFYMPYSNLLGPYIQEIGGRIGIIEVRPDEDLSAFRDFGYTKNAVSTETMYEKIREDNDNSVDQKSFLTARLFDLLIGDWDRHEDQWRWAEFDKKDKGTLFKPIPRDRDQVFTKFDGILPKLATLAIPDIQNFGYDIDEPQKLSLAAKNLDRNLINELSLNNWMEIANKMKVQITDEVIEKSVRRMPKEAFDLSGQEIINKLKSRRDQLDKVALKYYQVLAKYVTISGSDKYEYAEITRQKDSTQVIIYKIKKEGNIDKVIYTRTFDNNLTKDINIYLLDENDSLVVKGQSDRPIKITIVGGDGKDFLADSAENGKVKIFDTPDNTFVKGNQTSVEKSNGAWVNDYLRDNYKYDVNSVIPNLDFRNQKDGLLLGILYTDKRYGFRKEPYSFEQRLSLLKSVSTAGLFSRYNARFYSLFAHKYDLKIEAEYASPAYTFSFYGIGNNTTNINDDNDFYRVKSNTFSTAFYIDREINKHINFGVGPGYNYYKILNYSEPNFLKTTTINYSNPSQFLSLRSYFNINFIDNQTNPKTGIKFLNSAIYYSEINGDKDRFLNLSSSLSFYATPNVALPLTFALKLGAQTNIGNYKFYQANTLGNNTNLRGFRNQRYSGKSAYYANTELRFPVSTFRNYFLTGDFGVYTFYDIARVQNSSNESNIWHQGYGPGIWLNLYNNLMVSVGYGISDESNLFSLNVGFNF
jgi:hypothetical protein